MASVEFSTLIAQGENLHVEFKQWPVQPDDLAAAIVAFANTGGRLILQVTDTCSSCHNCLSSLGSYRSSNILLFSQSQDLGLEPNIPLW